MNESCCNANGRPSAKSATYTPACDVYETTDEITLSLDVPGSRSEDVDIRLEEGVLTVQAPVRRAERAGQRALYREYGVGDYVRTFQIGGPIDRDRIEATLTNGVLIVRVPKSEAARPRKIAVTGAAPNPSDN
jgi:HSP20 family protein